MAALASFLIALPLGVVSAIPVAALNSWIGGLHRGSVTKTDYLPTWASTAFLFTSLTLLLFGGALYRERRRLDRWVVRACARLQKWEAGFFDGDSRWVPWLLLSMAWVALFFWPSVGHGFFQFDDFDLLAVRRSRPLWDQILTVHADHSMPFFRIQIAAMHELFGVNPVPYNLWILSTFVAILFVGFLLLREMRAHPAGIALFQLLYIAWVDWGGVACGYYILIVYLEAALFSLVAAWSILRGHLLVAAIAVAGAVTVDIAGIWVAPAALLFGAAVGWVKPAGSKRKLLIWGAAVLAILGGVALFNFYLFAIRDGGGFLRMAGEVPRTLVGSIVQLFYLLAGGLLLFPISPVYPRLPAPVLVPLLVLAVATAAWAGWRLWKTADRPFRAFSAASLAILLGCSLMVVLGRTQAGLHHEWAVKHIGPAFLWLCILLALGWSLAWRKAGPRWRPLLLRVTALGCVAYLALQVVFSLSFGGGYRSYLNQAVARKAHIQEIRDRLVAPLFVTQSDASIPALDGKALSRKYPDLRLYDLDRYLEFIVPEGKRLTLLPVSGAGVSAEFIALLKRDPYVRDLYTR